MSFLGLGRSSIDQLEEDALYQNQRLLLEAEAKLCHAKTVAAQHEANVRFLAERCQVLQLRVNLNNHNPERPV